MVLDELDRRLLRLLLEDARRSYRTLAALAGTSTPTASARIRRMEELGIIEGYSVRLAPERFGGAGDDPKADLEAPVRVACHTCGKDTEEPEWWQGDGRRHPFCCATCKTSFVARFRRAAEDL